jgi:hypothetical protein
VLDYSLIELLVCAETGVGMTCGDELLGVLEVYLSALALPVGTKRATNVRACGMNQSVIEGFV